VTAVAAQRRGESDLVVGKLFNSLIGGAIVGFSAGRTPASARVTLPVAMILTAGLARALPRRSLALTRVEGVALLAAYGLTLPMLLSS
jgi:cation:H+ antiporter